MKRNLLIYLFFVLTLISVTKSQTISQEQKDSVIAQLNAEKNSTLYYATRTIITYDIYEAIPVLKEKIWEKEVEPRLYFLEALVALNAPAVSDYVLAFWDTLNNNIYNDVDSVSIRLNILLLLFQLNDYSEANYVFNVLSDTASYSLYNENIIDLLWFLLNSSIYEAAAKDKLIYFLNESTNREERSKALYWLDEKYGEDISSYVISRFHEDEDFSIRWSILYNILPKYNDNLVSEILKEKLVTEPDTLIRRQIARYILDSLGIPSNYKYIIDWLEDESSDIKLKEIIKRQFETVRPFIPFKPDISTTINTIIDSTVSYINQGENFGWVADDIFILELQSILLSAKTALQNGDSLACAVQIKSFQDSVDFVYADSLNADPRFVTIEGWKFLYWNAQYILDRLPEIPIVIAANIDVINPAMSLVNPGAFTMEVKGSGFNSSSVVYFNGNARATTFVSDSVLNTQILSTDVSAAGNFPVWVSDNSLNSDTLIYKVVSALPQPVRPVLECVTNNGDGTYTAFFGYKNENSVSVYIPVGSKNKFTPNPQDRGQTRVFKPGRQIKVYTVNFNGSNLVWTLNGRTSTASANSAPCQ